MARKRAKQERMSPGERLAWLGRRALGLGLVVAVVAIVWRFADAERRASASTFQHADFVLRTLALTIVPGFTLVLLARWLRARGAPRRRTRVVWALDLAAVVALGIGAWRLSLAWEAGFGATLLAALVAPWPALFLFAAARVAALGASPRSAPVVEAPRAPRPVTEPAPLAPPSASPPPAPTPTPSPLPSSLPPPPTPPLPTRWIPPGEACEVAGIALADGMLYVGVELASAADPKEPEPALLRPDLPINSDAARVRRPPHQPSYSTLPPSSRAAHLDWLASGRKDPDAELGYLWLFFYGLERRLLLDAEEDELEPAEVAALCDELRRLRATYHDQRAFRMRVEALLDHVELEHLAAGELPPPEPADAAARVMTLRMKLAVARAATRRRPLAPEWTRAWLELVSGGKLPATARRVPLEFDALFQARLAPRLARALEPPAGAPSIELVYEPASPSLAGRRYVARAALPDPSGWSEPREVLLRTAEECAEELAGFARWRTKHPERSPDLAALACLPRELLRARNDALLVGLTASLEAALGDDRCVLFPARGLFAGRKPGARPERSECAHIATLLGKLGFGIEPDVRFGGPRLELDERCALFRLSDAAPQAPSLGYEAATLVSHLATLVASAEGEPEEEAERSQLDVHLDTALQLDAAERERIDAHHLWLAARPRSLNGLTRRVAALSAAERARLGRFVVQVAGADGRVDHAEIVMLERIHALLGLDIERVHTELHALSTGERAPTEGTWEEEQAGEHRGVELDGALVRRKLNETKQVSALLQDVFAEEEDEEAAVPENRSAAAAPIAAQDARLAGLDSKHSAFLRALVARASWPRAELEELCEPLGLMLHGALDRLNETAFERCDAPLWEGEDPIEIDPETALELTR